MTTVNEVIKMSIDDISSQLQAYVMTELDNVIKDISSTYKLDYEELKTKYISNSPVAKTTEDVCCNNASCQPAAPKKRGRKKKQKEEFIEAEEYEFDGTVYLVDNKNTVYTNNVDAPTIVGERLIDGSIKFYSKS